MTLPKSMKNVTPTVTKLKANIRHVGGGYVFPYSSAGYDVLSDSDLTVAVSFKEDDYITITITSANALSVTSNTPLSISLEAVTLSFS